MPGNSNPHTYTYNILQWTLTNLKSLGPEVVQISEIFGLVNLYSLKVEWFNFHLMHFKIAMNITFGLKGFGLVRVNCTYTHTWSYATHH